MRRAVFSTVLSVFIYAVAPALPLSSAHADTADQDRSAREAAALKVVAKRNDAVNANDIEAFLAAYHPDFRIYQYPDRFLGEGTARMRDIFGPLFAAGEAAVSVHGQMVLDHTVVSRETLVLNGMPEDLISIYTVDNGLISEVRLIELKD